ncbi:MAG: glycosyltransferase [Anaerolineae bacterium]
MTGVQPTVSVIIPTYNRAELLIEALNSVLAQTFQDFEILIIDDGSTDDTKVNLEPYLADSRIRYIYQTNGGPANARNRGIDEAQGEFIALLDSDDLWLPEKLEKQVSLLRERLEIGLVYADVIWIAKDGSVINPQPVKAPRRFPTYYEDLMFENVIWGSDSVVIMRSEVLRSIPLYDSELPTLEDQDLWLRLSVCTEFCFLNEPLTKLRAHSSNLQHNPDSMALGRLRFLHKLQRDTPGSYRHHLPDVEYVLYRRIVFGYLLKKQYRAAIRYAIQMIASHPLSVVRITLDGVVRLTRVRSAHWR